VAAESKEKDLVVPQQKENSVDSKAVVMISKRWPNSEAFLLNQKTRDIIDPP